MVKYTPFLSSSKQILLLLSSLDKEYIFSFLGINHFFKSITWSHIFHVSILSLAFFPNILIHLWNLSRTNFFTSSSDLATSSFSFHISHSSATFFIFIFFLFFCLFFFCFFFSFFCFCYFLLLFSFSFAIPIFLASAFTTSHTFLDTLSSLLLLFSSQCYDCDVQAITFPKLLSTSVFLSHQSLFSFCIPNNKY